MSKKLNGVMLAGMRKLCMELPQVEEFEDKGVPSFRAGGQAFVRIGDNSKPLGPCVSLKLGDKAEGFANDSRFAAAQGGWLTLALYDTDWEELQELARECYQGIATEAMLEEFEQKYSVTAELV